MKRKIMVYIIFALILGLATGAQAVPRLQIGAPAGPGDSGIYADYIGSLSDPTEADTAVTGGDTIYAAGAYGPGIRNIGGQFGGGRDWSYFGFDTDFDGHGAVLMATVANNSLGSGTITVGGAGAFYQTDVYKDGFKVPSPPGNHAPIPRKDYLFFDIGDFAKNPLTVPNFATETGSAKGEIKDLEITVTGYEWIHFDVFALVTRGNNTNGWTTRLAGNPGSKDLTWKRVPEPSTLLLLGSGLLGVAVFMRKKRK